MVKLKKKDKELSVHVLQNPTELSAVLFTLIGDTKEYNIVVRMDERGLAEVGFMHCAGKASWHTIIPESPDEWIEIEY